MNRRWLIGAKPFLVTIIAVLATGYAKILLNAYFNMDSPIMLFLSAIAVSAWYGGASQGFFAYCLSILFIYNLLAGGMVESGGQVWLLRFGLFSIDALVVTTACAALRRSRSRLVLSEKRLRQIFDANMLGLVVSNPEGFISEANDYYLGLLGATRQELASGKLNWNDYTDPASAEISLEGARKLRTGQYFPPFEKFYRRKDGTRVAVLVGAAKIDEGTNIGFILDLSQSKTADQLKKSERFLESVIEFIPNMIFVKEAKNLSFVRFNRAGEELIGHPREELMGKSDYDFFPPDQAEFFIAKDRDVLKNKVVVDIPEEPISTPNGIKYLHTKKIPLFDNKGEPEYLLGISEDISEKKFAEQRQIELMQAQMARTEAEKSAARLTFLSDASARLNESLEAAMMLKSFAQLVTQKFASRCTIDVVDEAMSATVNRTFAWNTGGEKGVSHQCGIEIDEQVSQAVRSQTAHADGPVMIVPLGGYGKTLGAITLTVPDGAHAYDGLDLSIAKDLAKRAALAIENARLFNQAKEANRAKSAFLANISHELRTPLGAMLGFAELAIDSKSDKDIRQYVQTVLRNGKELLRIVDEVLDLSKAESNSIEIENIRFSLPVLLNDIRTLLVVRSEQKDLNLKFSNRGDLPEFIHSDPFRIRQILLNIVGNAIKFTDHGSVSVETSYRGGLLQFEISDTGIGIDAAQTDRLFSPFTQADDSTTRKFGGTGLGLFLSRRLAGLMGGDVRLLQSTPQKGSTFLVTVQVTADAAISKTLSEREVHRTSSNQEDDLSYAKVLVVDDSPDNQDLITAYLAKNGIKPSLAGKGQEAVDIADNSFHAILMDIQMPEMDGFEALRRLREKGVKVPVVAVTAHAMKGDRERCLNAGFDDYLCKPLSRADLKNCLHKLIDGP